MPSKRKTQAAEKAEQSLKKQLTSLEHTSNNADAQTKAVLRNEINRLLDAKPEIVSHKILFHLNLGTYEPTRNNDADDDDVLARSSNTWALTSRERLFEFARGAGLAPDDIMEQMMKTKGKKNVLQLITFRLHVKQSSHLYSKSMGALVEGGKQRFTSLGKPQWDIKLVPEKSEIDWAQSGYFKLIPESKIPTQIKTVWGETTSLPEAWQKEGIELARNDCIDAAYLKDGLSRASCKEIFQNVSINLAEPENLTSVPEGQRGSRSPASSPTPTKSRVTSPSASSACSRASLSIPAGFGGVNRRAAAAGAATTPPRAAAPPADDDVEESQV